tara:strand:- start:568 stop:1386 length:819 start_codon:yes stop_codon:yes gene_type:complete
MLLNIERINKIFNDNECIEDITLNNSTFLENDNDNKTLKNMLLVTKYNSRIHLISYLYLKQINQMLLLLFICSSFITGLVEIINYKTRFSEDIYLVFGLTDIFLSLILVTYKNLKIPNTEQDHHNYHIQYKNMINDINLNLILYNKPAFIYKNLDVYLINLFNKFNLLNISSPKIPKKVLEKYNIHQLKCCERNNELMREGCHNKIKTILTNDDNNVIIKSNSFTLKDLNELSNRDINNLSEFIIKIDNINSDKYKNRNFIKFKDALGINKN